MARPKNLSAADALARLKEGNTRAVEDKPQHANQGTSRRSELTGGQQPFATIIACADSRVAPEIVFDQGLGDIFVIRVAGNIADPAILGSIEYASLHLGVNLVVVMGHSSCGAVAATLDATTSDAGPTNTNIDSLVEAIQPALVTDGDNALQASIESNAKRVSAQIAGSKEVLAGLKADGLVVQPACYHLDSGKVDFL